MTILEAPICIIYVLISGHLVHSPVVFSYTFVSWFPHRWTFKLFHVFAIINKDISLSIFMCVSLFICVSFSRAVLIKLFHIIPYVKDIFTAHIITWEVMVYGKATEIDLCPPAASPEQALPLQSSGSPICKVRPSTKWSQTPLPPLTVWNLDRCVEGSPTHWTNADAKHSIGPDGLGEWEATSVTRAWLYSEVPQAPR